MKKLSALLLTILLTSCTTISQPESFKLQTGETVECLQYEQMECGLALRGCGEERSVEFECLKDVHYIGGPLVKADEPKAEGETK